MRPRRSRPQIKDNAHEGLTVTDGQNEFRIINGCRVWQSSPPPDLRNELSIEAERLRLSISIRQSSIASLSK